MASLTLSSLSFLTTVKQSQQEENDEVWVLSRSKRQATQLQRDSAFGQCPTESLHTDLGATGSGEVDSDEILERVQVLESSVGDPGVTEFQSLAGRVVLEIQQCDVGDPGVAEIESLKVGQTTKRLDSVIGDMGFVELSLIHI